MFEKVKKKAAPKHPPVASPANPFDDVEEEDIDETNPFAEDLKPKESSKSLNPFEDDDTTSSNNPFEEPVANNKAVTSPSSPEKKKKGGLFKKKKAPAPPKVEKSRDPTPPRAEIVIDESQDRYVGYYCQLLRSLNLSLLS
jgi:hypothetical protein